MYVETLAEAVNTIVAGNILAVQTDTVIGLLIDGGNITAKQKLYKLKQRDTGKPMILFVDTETKLADYVRTVPVYADYLMAALWPGALTCIFNKNLENQQLTALGDKTTLAVRMPANKAILALVQACHCPIASTSANISGTQPLQTLAQVESAFGAQVAVWKTAQTDNSNPMASTIIKCTAANTWELIREGSITKETIWQIIDTNMNEIGHNVKK